MEPDIGRVVFSKATGLWAPIHECEEGVMMAGELPPALTHLPSHFSVLSSGEQEEYLIYAFKSTVQMLK